MCLLKLSILINIVSIVFARRITFPNNDNHSNVCRLSNNETGACVDIRYCKPVLTNIQPTQTCYFQGFKQFVCCSISQISFRYSEHRPAAKACDYFYPLVHFIYHGLVTKEKEFPYMVALGFESFGPEEYDFKCGGILISNTYAVTAAHCANIHGLEPAIVLPGGVNLTDPTAKPCKIIKVIVHPHYDAKNVYNDIALIEFVNSTSYFPPACIWSEAELREKLVTAVGYGHTTFAGIRSDQLLKAPLEAMSNEECKQHYLPDDDIPNGIMSTQLCCRDPLKLRDTCQGDSGGPVISYITRKSTVRPYLIGITSFGRNCAGGQPGVYTRVSAYTDWIESIVFRQFMEGNN